MVMPAGAARIGSQRASFLHGSVSVAFLVLLDVLRQFSVLFFWLFAIIFFSKIDLV